MNDLEITQAVSRVLSKYTTTPVPPQAENVRQPAPAAVAQDASIEAIVASIMADRQAEPAGETAAGDGVFASMDEAIAAARQAGTQYRHCSMQDRARFVDGIRQLFLQQPVLETLSRMAVEETGMGNYADKLVKNRVAAQKTPGVEDLTTCAISGDCGLTLVEHFRLWGDRFNYPDDQPDRNHH